MKTWTFDKIKEEAFKYKSRQEFNKKSNQAYQAARKRKILDQVCSHMPPSICEPYTFEELKNEALKYKTRNEFKKLNHGAYTASHRRDILDEICVHMGEPKNQVWTETELAEEALKYNTRTQFARTSESAYQTARKNKLLNKICAHMELKYKNWTFEKLQIEALKYKSRGEFREKSNSAYQIVKNKKLLEIVCAHMEKSRNVSIPENLLFNIIKSIYPKTQKFYDRKVKLENKPYIQGFDLDIYIPELRKAIEFDGEYWHSIEGLKRSRGHWTEKDLSNYSKIKDAWFLSKGIQILHIKEEDWIKDKEGCIKKCLIFLDSRI